MTIKDNQFVPRVFFCSFADSRIKRSLIRIRNQAEKMNIYDEILTFTENDLDPIFRKEHENLLKQGTRGFGYWVWKPQVILQVLKISRPGDIIHYADAGCWLNKRGRPRLQSYLEMCNNSKSGILAFQIPETPPTQELADFKWPERCWSKGDIFDHFKIRENKEFSETNQILATSIFIKNSEHSRSIIERWHSFFSTNINLINDTPSISENLPGFIENRHDQSIFSILMKFEGGEHISSFELCYPRLIKNRPGSQWVNSWSDIKTTPIWGKRDKDLGLIIRMKTKIRNRYHRYFDPIFRFISGEK